MKCRVCKCTYERACANGCGWAQGRGDLCTNCAGIVEALSDYVEVACSFNQAGLLREMRAGFVQRQQRLQRSRKDNRKKSASPPVKRRAS